MKQPDKTLGQIAAEKVLDDLKDRKGVGDELEQIEPDIYEELQTTLAQIIDSVAQARPPVKSLEEIAREAEIEMFGSHKPEEIEYGIIFRACQAARKL